MLLRGNAVFEVNRGRYVSLQVEDSLALPRPRPDMHKKTTLIVEVVVAVVLLLLTNRIKKKTNFEVHRSENTFR